MNIKIVFETNAIIQHSVKLSECTMGLLKVDLPGPKSVVKHLSLVGHVITLFSSKTKCGKVYTSNSM